MVTRYYTRTFKTIGEMEKELADKYTPNWGNQLSVRALIYACKRLDEIAELLKNRRKPRKPSAYNKFLSSRLRQGKTFTQVAEEWNRLKANSTKGAE